MKKNMFLIGAAMAVSLAAGAENDRLDFYDADGKFVSVMTDDVIDMKVERSAEMKGEGYDLLVIETPYGTQTYRIAALPEIKRVAPDATPHSITLKDAPNAHLVLWNCFNNPSYLDPEGAGVIDPTKPYDWTGAPKDFTVLFDVRPQKGFAYTYTITGEYTGKRYSDNPLFVFISEPDDNLLGVKAMAYHMPYEPVMMELESEELSTYAGAPFLGNYKGYSVAQPAKKRISHKPASQFDMEFKANGTYHFTATDSEQLDVTDLFTWNEEENSFAYVPYEGPMKNEIDLEIKRGALGRFIDGGFMLTTIHNVIDDRPENNRTYLAARGDFDFTLASADDYGFRMLAQAVPADGSATRYWYFEDYGSTVSEVNVEFVSGSNLGQTSTAYVVRDGEKLFRYEYLVGDTPVFTARGSEFGEYTGNSGKLTVDGFGSLTLGSESGTYTVQGGLLTAKIGQGVRLFVIDGKDHTYSEMVADAWKGADFFSLDTALGAFRGGELNNQNYISIALDKDLRGNASPGDASVTINIRRNDGFGGGFHGAVASIGKYIYNAESRTIVVTNVLVGSSPTVSGRRNLVLKLSDDLRSMWLDDSTDARIYTTDHEDSYVLTGPQNTLTAPAPAAPSLAPAYNGAHMVTFYGSPRESQSSLTIDEAAGKATIRVTIMGADAINSTVDYVLDGTELTLKGVTVGTKDAFVLTPQDLDLKFTIEDDGSLSSTENEVYCNHNQLVRAFVDFSSARFVPAE